MRHGSGDKTNVLGYGESFGTIFQKPQIDLEAKNWVEGLKEVKKYFKK